jgi:phosphonate transport system substrate-binding protein
MKRAFLFFQPSNAVLSLVFASLASLTVPFAAIAQTQIIFGTYAADKPTETVRKFKPFLSFLEGKLTEELGEPVSIKMRISKEYADSIDQLASGSVDFARFGPASYVTLKAKSPDAQIIAMESKKGKKRFKGVVAVHADSDFVSLSDLSDSRFAFGDELSTIGRYLAQSELLAAGISGEDLGEFKYLGRHDLVGTAVGNGSFDAGALKESTFKKLVAKGVPIRALVTFENVTKPWIASTHMPPRIFKAMKTVMLDPTNKEKMKSIAKHGFLEGTNADYELIRKAMKRSENF